MTQPPNIQDEQWFAALAGNPDPTADPEINREALALRKALKARGEQMAKEIPKADSAHYEQLMFRLRREGLIDTGRHSNLSKRFVRFAVAASVMLSVGLLFLTQLHQNPQQNEAEAIRGLGDMQIVLAVDPEKHLTHLTSELDRLRINYQVERIGDEISLKIEGIDPRKEEVETFLKNNHIKPPIEMSLNLIIQPMTKP
jgi:hypothetical protein